MIIHIILHLLKIRTSLHMNKMVVLAYFYIKIKYWPTSWCHRMNIFVIFMVDQYFDSINTGVKSVALHKYIVQNGRSMFKSISEIAGNPVLILSQNSFKHFLFWNWSQQLKLQFLKSSILTQCKIIHTNLPLICWGMVVGKHKVFVCHN